jgi:GT2 family glycosyltransferase
MKLSVIILNYNVKGFLEQCLRSVQKAIKSIESEVWVVDNNSHDGSVEMVKEKFPWAILVASKENLGFSRGNNLAIYKAKGEYILLLNPDTVVPEDCFEKTLAFMEANPNAGGLGVRMVDGKGNFLPESKRGLPTPWVALAKISGLSNFFPHNKLFGKYYMAYLSEFENNPVEILSGAFMLMPKKVINEVGSLDDTFFMYGEDIDLSYRILLGGYQNYYIADTTIIHYKGESTKKNSLSYVKNFYFAMVIFAQKHLSKKLKLGYQFIKMAVYLRAFLAIFTRAIKAVLMPVLDVSSLVILSIIFTVEPNAVASLLLIFSAWLSGLYDKKQSFLVFLRNVFTSLLPVYFFIKLSQGVWATTLMITLVFSLSILRFLHGKLLGSPWFSQKPKPDDYLVVCPNAKFNQHSNNIKIANLNYGNFYWASDAGNWQDEALKMIKSHKLSEVVIDTQNIAWKNIISFIQNTRQLPIDVKIALADTNLLIGSNSVAQTGKILQSDFYKIKIERNKRFKAAFELLVTFLIALGSPFILSKPKRKQFFENFWDIIWRKKFLVGFSPNHKKCSNLGDYEKASLISAAYIFSLTPANINEIYASDYRLVYDYRAVRRWISD